MSEDEVMVPATVELTTSPELAIKKGTEAVTSLMKLLDQKDNPVIINNKRHIEFDDWIILGNFYGIDVRTGDSEPIEVFGIKGFKAKAEVVRIDDGIVIGGAEAYCMRNERNWKTKPWFQLASMAQTRAGSKALSNVLRGFVALKGISGTPAEEMETIKNGNNRQPAPPRNNAPPAPPKSAKKPVQSNEPEWDATMPKPTKVKNPEPENTQDAELSPELNTDQIFSACPAGLKVAEAVRKEKKPLTKKNINNKAVAMMPEPLDMDDVKEINKCIEEAEKEE